jgi:hypothetical protein
MMKWVCCVVLLTLCAQGRALAITEYCPATVSQFTAIGAKMGMATLYSLYLRGEGKRSVDATVVVDTSGGWYSVALPTVDLTARKYVYESSTTSSFPKPSPFEVNSSRMPMPSGTMFLRRLIPTPSVRAPLRRPARWTALRPLFAASVRKQAAPAYPTGVVASEQYTSLIQVAIAPDGTLDDAWVDLSSGVHAFDEAALAAARASTYRGGTSFCEPAPGRHIFRADFDPY